MALELGGGVERERGLGGGEREGGGGERGGGER